MTAPKTKTKIKKAIAEKLNSEVAPYFTEVEDPMSDVADVSVYFNGVEYKPGKEHVQEIKFLGTKTLQAKIKPDLSVFWNPLIWDWTKTPDKEAFEMKYKRKCQSVYFKDKVFLVEKSKIKKGIVNDEFVDTAELPIGIVVYWSIESKTWEMLGYKETLFR